MKNAKTEKDRSANFIRVALTVASIIASILVVYSLTQQVAPVSRTYTLSEITKTYPTISSLSYTREIGNLTLVVSVPEMIPVSATGLRKAVKVDVFISKSGELSGIPDVDLEAGVSTSIPSKTINLFLDIDVTLLNNLFPDVFRFKWPISGLPLSKLDVEKGDVGLYTVLIPIREERINLLDIPENTLIHVGSYELYVIAQPSLEKLNISLGNIIIGPVKPTEEYVTPITTTTTIYKNHTVTITHYTTKITTAPVITYTTIQPVTTVTLTKTATTTLPTTLTVTQPPMTITITKTVTAAQPPTTITMTVTKTVTATAPTATQTITVTLTKTLTQTVTLTVTKTVTVTIANATTTIVTPLNQTST